MRARWSWRTALFLVLALVVGAVVGRACAGSSSTYSASIRIPRSGNPRQFAWLFARDQCRLHDAEAIEVTIRRNHSSTAQTYRLRCGHLPNYSLYVANERPTPPPGD